MKLPRVLNSLVLVLEADALWILCPLRPRFPCTELGNGVGPSNPIWVVVKLMVRFWIPIIIRHLICRVPKKGP